MAGSDTSSRELGELLTDLKRRSGRSYESIGRRVNASKSTVQRICTGQSVPSDFARIEQVARTCGADTQDIVRLFKLWTAAVHASETTSTPETTATTETTGTSETTATPAATAISATASTAIAGDAEPVGPDNRLAPWRQPRLLRHSLAPAVLAVLLAAVLAISTDGPAAPHTTATGSDQRITGPAWTLPPRQVAHTLFGVTINSSTGLMPSFDVGAVRLWDSGTRWADIEPYPGEFDWTVLDRLMAGARQAELPVLFVLGGTPGWANPTAPVGPYPDGARAAPPKDLAEWDTYVHALVERYRGQIDGYELWALANDPRYFNGSVSTLVDMTRRAAQIIRSVDPKATVVCPGMGNLWGPDGQRVLRQFAAAGGYNYCDVASIKLYQRAASDPPETMLKLATTVDQLFHASGLGPRLWSTGTTYSITLQRPLLAEQARNYAVRFFLVGIYARYLNIERMYFYNWGSSKIPIVLQSAGGEPTAAALAVEQLQHWLAHAQSLSCGHGLPINVPDNVWQCDFRILDPGHTYNASVVWTDSGSATVTAEPSVVAVHRLDGSTAPVGAGDAIKVSEEPQLVEHR